MVPTLELRGCCFVGSRPGAAVASRRSGFTENTPAGGASHSATAGLSARPLGRPPNGAERRSARPTGRTAEPAPHVRKWRFSDKAGQQGRHWHRCVVVAVQARDGQFAGTDHQICQGRRDGHRPLLNRRRHHGRRAWSSRSRPWSASTRSLFRRSHCPAAGGGGAAPRLPGSAQQHARPVDQADRSSSPQRRPQKCNAIENRLLGGVVCRDGPFAHWSRLLAPPEHPVRSSAGPAAASAHRCSGRHPWRPGPSLRRS